MNISVGSSAPSSSRTYQHSARMVASQRLLQQQQPAAVATADRLIPSRRREEQQAVQNVRRRLELAKLLRCTINDDFMNAVFQRSHVSWPVPQFLKKIISMKTTNFVHDEDCQEDIFDNDFIKEALLWHNVYRRHHKVPPLKLSAQLCGKAQAWANHLAHTNTFQYENDKSVGQNIFCRLTSNAQVEVPAQEIVSYWYSCYKNYIFTKESETLHININAGNFTQLVWKGTKYFGIGRARSRVGKMLVVANYQPPGNVSGCFQENVLPANVNKEFYS